MRRQQFHNEAVVVVATGAQQPQQQMMQQMQQAQPPQYMPGKAQGGFDPVTGEYIVRSVPGASVGPHSSVPAREFPGFGSLSFRCRPVPAYHPRPLMLSQMWSVMCYFPEYFLR